MATQRAHINLRNIVNTVKNAKTCNGVVKEVIYQDETWQAMIIKPYQDKTEHFYTVKFSYKNGCAGTKTIRFINEEAQIKHSGSGEKIKVKNDIKNTILEVERMLTFNNF